MTSEASAVADKAANNAAKVAAPKGKAGKAKKAKAKKGKASKPAAKEGAGKPAAQPAEAPAVLPAPKVPSAEDIIVQAIAAGSRKTDSQGNAVDGPSNFATDYLLAPTNGSRRRPGPSLNPFKGMAKDVNPRLK